MTLKGGRFQTVEDIIKNAVSDTTNSTSNSASKSGKRGGGGRAFLHRGITLKEIISMKL
jgi:hypothetical protein